MLLKNKEYNPKIDYLLCKYLLREIPEVIDENHLKDCFFDKASCETDEELVLCMTRNFFMEHNLLSMNEIEIQMFLEFLNVEYTFKGFVGNSLEDKIYNIILTLKDKSIEDKRLILKFLLVVAYIQENGKIILPYQKGIQKLLTSNTLEEIRLVVVYLEKKTTRLNNKHDLRINSIVLDILKILSSFFLEITGYLGIGVYGSFSTHTSNEYSDLDLIIFISEGLDKYEVRRHTKKIIRRFIPIPIDIKVTTKEEMENDLTIGMKKTLKILGGEIKWKKSTK